MQDAPERARRSAGDRAAAVAKVQDGRAAKDVALEHGVAEVTLKRWIARAAAAAAAGLVETAGLADRRRSGRPPKVWERAGAEAAYQLWRRLYMRPEQPTAAGCLRTVERLAVLRRWELPEAKAFMRRLRAETPAAEIVRSREGRIAALATYPHQRRTVEGLAPLDIVNGDGYRHNLFVLPDGEGKPFRPVTWFWQDVRTRRVLAWRSGPTESSDLVRLSFYDMATTLGVPRKVLQDNTRAASSRWFAGSGLRWRKDRDAVPTILQELGVTPMRTGVEREDNGKARGRGQAKPVERAFSAKDLGETIDKHPRAAGAWTGPNPMEKPANYDESHALPWETFMAVVADGVGGHNARTGRRTEAAAGRSFDDVWEAELATTPVRRLTRAQEAILLMAAESTVVQRSGLFRLAAGRAVGVPQNDYWHQDLINRAGERVVARFDPQQLHGAVEVFDLKGRWLCRAECRLPVGFDDVDGARQHARARRQHIRALDQAHAAQGKLDDTLDEYGIDLPAAAPPKRQQQKVVRMTPAAPGRPDTERRRALQAKLDRGLKRVAERDS